MPEKCFSLPVRGAEGGVGIAVGFRVNRRPGA